ncbi:hypothetical protein SAMN05428944_6791 [Streptomyces sp. 1222.5]|nr:hypothetical protein BX260_1305 [Streptomyces sp. 5112.2]SED19590.1 hypothetical protein SAMN05428944_6791 [Streptomyces sp. 1222.5]
MSGSTVFRTPDDALLEDVERSGDRLVRAAAGLSAADLRGPSGRRLVDPGPGARPC